ncbi:MAG: lipocalin-like domain-containing protein [Planctomycetota bacterium]
MSKLDCRRSGIMGGILLFPTIVFLVMPVILQPCQARASDGFLHGDPMVRITAPPAIKVDKAKVLDELSKDISRDTGLDRSLLTCYWQVFDEINCMGEKVDDHPIFVDLYVPGFLTDDIVAKVMHSVASSLARQMGIEKKWVFIHTHTAEQGRVLLSGEVQYFKKPKDKTGKAGTPTPALSNNQIVGTWKLRSMTYEDESTGKETDLWGKDPIGFLSYTPGGRMSALLAAADRKIAAPTGSQSSIEEQAKLFRNSFGYAGTYTLTKDGVVHHVEVATDPAWIGQDQIRFTRIESNRLIISAPPLRTVGDLNPKVLVLTWERIE